MDIGGIHNKLVEMEAKLALDRVNRLRSQTLLRLSTGKRVNSVSDTLKLSSFLSYPARKLTADQKKDFICDILIYVVDNTDAGSLESLDPIIKKMIPNVIDTILRVEGGNLHINSTGCLSKLPCFH